MNSNDILASLITHNESLFTLEREFAEFPVKSAKVYSLKAEAIKTVNKLSLRLELVVAQIVKDIFKEYELKGKPLASSSRSEVRKTMVPLNKKYIQAKRELNEALFNKDNLEGLAKSFEAKGYMLRELAKMSDRTHFNEPTMYRKEVNSKEKRVNDNAKMESRIDTLNDILEY